MYNNKGYNYISIYLDGKQYKLGEHQLNALINNTLKDVFNPDNEVHHWNRCPIDNRLENLEVMSKSEHMTLHVVGRTGENHPMFGKNHSEESREKISKSRANYTGDKHPNFNPCIKIRKNKKKTCKQGFIWIAQPYVNGKMITLSSVDLEKCIEKVEDFINGDKNTYGYTSYEVNEE